MDDENRERIRQAIVDIVIKLSEVVGRGTSNPRIAELVDRVIQLINEFLDIFGGAGLF